MASRTAVCRKYLKHLQPMEDSAEYWCDSCQETVTIEDLLGGDTGHHQLLFPHKRTVWPEDEAALRGAVSVPSGEAGALTLVEEN